jgi:hypothetical protein
LTKSGLPMPWAQGVGRSNRPAPTNKSSGSRDKVNERREARKPPESRNLQILAVRFSSPPTRIRSLVCRGTLTSPGALFLEQAGDGYSERVSELH